MKSLDRQTSSTFLLALSPVPNLQLSLLELRVRNGVLDLSMSRKAWACVTTLYETHRYESFITLPPWIPAIEKI